MAGGRGEENCHFQFSEHVLQVAQVDHPVHLCEDEGVRGVRGVRVM